MFARYHSKHTVALNLSKIKLSITIHVVVVGRGGGATSKFSPRICTICRSRSADLRGVWSGLPGQLRR